MNAIARLLTASVVAICSIIAQPASSTTLEFSANGVFNANAPTTFFSAPNATWAMSFRFDSNPVPILVVPDTGFVIGLTDFSASLNGVAVSEIANSIGFYLFDAINSGGIDIYYNDIFNNPSDPSMGFEFYGAQNFTGPEDNPTILPGVYDTFLMGNADSFAIVVNNTRILQGSETFTITAIPEPPALALVLMGLGLLAAVARHRRHR